MLLGTNFKGRVFQVLDALDYGDAVSNQAIALGKMLAQMGFATAIYNKWYHPAFEGLRQDIDALVPTDQDVVILHFSGFSEFALIYACITTSPPTLFSSAVHHFTNSARRDGNS